MSEKGRKRKSLHGASGQTPKKSKTSHHSDISQSTDAKAPAIEDDAVLGAEEDGGQGKKSRFIVFVGNLPYTTTNDAITKHFAKIKPQSIRHRTEKGSEKSKGFAFLEFDGFDRMQTCLKLYHHSEFNDGVSPTRRINVELTAGGGGKGKDRKEKIQAKNQKLKLQRKNKVNEEKRAKKVKQQEETSGIAKGKAADSKTDIHPARQALIGSKGQGR